MATPQLQQCFVSSCNPVGIGGDTGSAFKRALPAAIGAGNGIIIAASYPHGTTTSITDNNGNTWGAAVKTADAGVGGYVLAVWVLFGANAGITTFELNVGATNIQPVSWAIYEFNNLSAVDVSVSNNALASGTSGTGSLAIGSMTTTISGDLIFAVYHPNGAVGGNPTSWVAGSGFALMEADIAWNSAQGYPKATQTQIQSSAGAINPTIAIHGDTNNDGFNGVAVAIKTNTSGAQYTGMRCLKQIEFCNNNQTATAWKFQNPALGNLRAWGSTFDSVNASSVTDSDSSTYSKVGFTTDSCVAFFAQNTAANSSLTTTINLAAGAVPNGFVFSFYDIVGAAISGQPGAVASTDLILDATATFAHAPDFTPQSSAGSLILYFMQNQGTGAGAGPTLNITSPAGAVWAGMTYTGHTGGGQFDFGDGWGILTNNTSVASQNVTWSLIALAGNNLAGAAVEFLPAIVAVKMAWGQTDPLPVFRFSGAWDSGFQPLGTIAPPPATPNNAWGNGADRLLPAHRIAGAWESAYQPLGLTPTAFVADAWGVPDAERLLPSHRLGGAWESAFEPQGAIAATVAPNNAWGATDRLLPVHKITGAWDSAYEPRGLTPTIFVPQAWAQFDQPGQWALTGRWDSAYPARSLAAPPPLPLVLAAWQEPPPPRLTGAWDSAYEPQGMTPSPFVPQAWGTAAAFFDQPTQWLLKGAFESAYEPRGLTPTIFVPQAWQQPFDLPPRHRFSGAWDSGFQPLGLVPSPFVAQAWVAFDQPVRHRLSGDWHSAYAPRGLISTPFVPESWALFDQPQRHRFAGAWESAYQPRGLTPTIFIPQAWVSFDLPPRHKLSGDWWSAYQPRGLIPTIFVPQAWTAWIDPPLLRLRGAWDSVAVFGIITPPPAAANVIGAVVRVGAAHSASRLGAFYSRSRVS